MYRPAVIRCRLHTGGKTVMEIKARYTGQGLTYRGFESLQRAFDLFDGQTIMLYKKSDGGETVYYVARWPKENMKIMDAVFEAEQTHPDRRYTDDRQKFMMDWLTGKYSAGMAFAFLTEDVEELEVVQPEVNEPDPPPEQAAPPRWRQIRDKRARRRKGRGRA